MGYRLGVDLGTTFTAAAMRNGGPPSMLGLGNRALQIPSVLYLQEDGKFLVGEAAERRGATDPSRVVREFKRRIGDPIPLMVGGTPFSAQALSARLLSSVVATATERRGGPPDEIVLTYPANWGAYKRELVDQVISLADVGPTVTCPEPQAAAIQYAAQAHLQAGDRVAVYDLGGGTFDVCVLQKTSNGFKILGNPEGIEQLGGVDFDEAVFQHVVGALGSAMEDLDLDSSEGRTALTRLRRDCVEAKEALSVDVDTEIPVTLPGRSTSVRLTRAELESLIAPALEQTVEATGRALRAAGTTSEQLTAIVLVGGSSRIPLVSHLLQSRFATPTALDTHPKHDIALGAVQFSQDQDPSNDTTTITPTGYAGSPGQGGSMPGGPGSGGPETGGPGQGGRGSGGPGAGGAGQSGAGVGGPVQGGPGSGGLGAGGVGAGAPGSGAPATGAPGAGGSGATPGTGGPGSGDPGTGGHGAGGSGAGAGAGGFAAAWSAAGGPALDAPAQGARSTGGSGTGAAGLAGAGGSTPGGPGPSGSAPTGSAPSGNAPTGQAPGGLAGAGGSATTWAGPGGPGAGGPGQGGPGTGGPGQGGPGSGGSGQGGPGSGGPAAAWSGPGGPGQGGAGPDGTTIAPIPKPTRQPLPAKTKQLIAMVAAGVLLISGGVFAGVKLLGGDSSKDAKQNTTAPPASNSSGPNPTGPTTPTTPSAPNTTSGLKPLPVAATPLSDSQLIMPIETPGSPKPGQSLFVADARSPGSPKKISVFAGTSNGVDRGPVVSPDRKSVIFLRDRPSTNKGLWVSGVDGAGARPLFSKTPAQCSAGIDRPAWNKVDPTQIVATCKGAKTTGVYLIDTDGTVIRTLFEIALNAAKPQVSDAAVSPDGNRVAFQAVRIVGNAQGIYTVPIDGSGRSNPYQVTVGADADPTFSPTAPGVIAYRHLLAQGSWSIYLTSVEPEDSTNGQAWTAMVREEDVACAKNWEDNPLKGGRTRLCPFTDGSTLDQDPTWSPEGDQIAFRRGPVTSAQIYVAPFDGSTAPRAVLPTDPGNQSASSWTAR